ncbi:MAG: hypothetical protein F4Y94_04100 [Chloroflexi bacterium]|nr:hypothetical protein [Chloroflexota bacterium]
MPVWPSDVSFHPNAPAVNRGIHEWIVIDGRPAEVIRWRRDDGGEPRETTGVSLYDAATGVSYWFSGGHKPPTNDPEVLVELVRKFLPDAHPSACRPRAPAGGRSNDVATPGLEDCGLPVLTLGYDRPPTATGSVTDAGDYAFLSDPDDLTTTITTYEGLRDGLREGNPIGLLLHQSDDRGVSYAAFYDLVRVGDLVQWWQSSSCWVRYQVTEIHPDPPGSPPRTLLTIQVYSYAAHGWCSGTLAPPDDYLRQLFDWTPWVIRTGNITVPFQHGPFLVAPEDWDGPLSAPDAVTLIDTPWPPDPLPDPDLGLGWTGGVSAGGLDDGDALFVSYRHESGGRLEGAIYRLSVWPRGVTFHQDSWQWRYGPRDRPGLDQSIHEWILIDGRPAEVTYDIEGALGENAGVSFYDAATGVLYVLTGSHQPPTNDPEILIELARKFLPTAR